MTVKRGKQWLWQEASQRPVLVGCMRDQQRLRRQCEAEIRIAIGTFFLKGSFSVKGNRVEQCLKG